MNAADDISIWIYASAHFEWILREEIGVAIGAVMAINREARNRGAALTESDRVCENIRAARFRPLVAIHDPSAAWNQQLDRAAARGWSGIHQQRSVRPIRVVGSSGRDRCARR